MKCKPCGNSMVKNGFIRRVKFFVHCWNQRQLFRRAFPKYDRPLFSFASFPF